ncbi:MAG TPA: hypothetical protein VII93_14345 [Anaerolineales bacterium]
MKQQTIPIDPNQKVTLESIPGDLRAAGWDRPEIMAKTDGEKLDIISATDGIVISCEEDLILYLPRSADLNVKKVAGDAILQAINGPVALGPVAGDLTINDLGPVTLGTVSGDASLRNTGALNADTITGDFTLRGGNGVCAVENVGGDASVRDVDGMVTIADVGSDLYVRNVHGAVTVNAGADVALYLSPVPGQTYDVNAGDDLIVRLTPEVKVKLHLNANSPESIQVDFPGVDLPEDCTSCEVLIGEQDEGVAEMLLTAGGDLLVTSQADPWKSAADFDHGDWHIPPIPPIPPLPPDFSERINRRVEASLQRAQAHIDAATRRSDAKVQAAMHRAEAKARAAEVRARSWQGRVVMGGRTVMNVSSSAPQGEPVSDDERLTVLKMLQEKKITLEEAEKLLAALEGK